MLNINLDLSNVKTAIPLIADQTYALVRFAGVEQAEKEGKQSLKFKLECVQPTPTQGGDPVNPGFPVFDLVTLYDKNTPAGEVPEWAKQKISRIIDAFLGTGDPNNKEGKPARPAFSAETVAQLMGQQAYALVKITKGQDETERNNVAKYVHLNDAPKA